MGEKKKTVKGAERESKVTGLKELRKVEKAEEVRRGWYGMYSAQRAYAELAMKKYCARAVSSSARRVKR